MSTIVEEKIDHDTNSESSGNVDKLLQLSCCSSVEPVKLYSTQSQVSSTRILVVVRTAYTLFWFALCIKMITISTVEIIKVCGNLMLE